MNTKQRVERLRAIREKVSWAEDIVATLNEELAEDEFQARHVESVELGSGRWYDHMLEVVELDKGFYVGLCWDSGLTESQENMYEDDDVYRLERVERVVTTIDWNTKETL